MSPDEGLPTTSVLDHPMLSERLFFPRRESWNSPERFDVPVDGGATLACLWFHRHPSALTLLHFHGNGEIVTDYMPEFVHLILDMGVNICLVEYRGYGASTGTPALAAMLGDGERVVEGLKIPDNRLVVFGRSIGSIYAVELASRRPKIAGLVLESGIADVKQRVDVRLKAGDLGTTEGALRDELGRLFDQRAKLAKYPGPLLTLHTRRDGLIDMEHGERLHAWGGGTDKELVIFEAGNHNTISLVNHRDYFDRLENFFEKVGRKSK